MEKETITLIKEKLNINHSSTIRRNNILTDGKLVELIINNDILSEVEVLKIYKCDKTLLRRLRQESIISFFSVEGINITSQGRSCYYIKSEIEEVFGLTLCYDKGFGLRFRKSINLLIESNIDSILQSQGDILRLFFIEKKTLNDIAELKFLSNARVNQLLHKGIASLQRTMKLSLSISKKEEHLRQLEWKLNRLQDMFILILKSI